MNRRRTVVMLVLVLIFAGTHSLYAGTEVGNRICPVSKEHIPDGTEVKYEYNGKVYNLCCKMCLKDFKKDPEKFSKLLEDMEKEKKGSHEDGHHDHDH